MNKGIWLGSLLAAVVVFVWGFLFWGLPIINPIDSGVDGAKAQEALKQLVPAGKDGVYFVPAMPGDQMTEEWAALHRQGPLVTLIVRQAGAPPMAPTVFLLGFLHNFVTACLIGLLLSKVVGALPSYGARLAFVALAGLAATIWGHAGDPIWMYHPWRFHVLAMIYDIIAWGLTGSILARFVKP